MMDIRHMAGFYSLANKTTWSKQSTNQDHKAVSALLVKTSENSMEMVPKILAREVALEMRASDIRSKSKCAFGS